MLSFLCSSRLLFLLDLLLWYLLSFPTRRSSDLAVMTSFQQSMKVCAWTGPMGTTRMTRPDGTDRKSTRLNSSHVAISYAVFCLKKKKIYFITIKLYKLI